mgnify:CR=1 FL=1
MILRPFHLEDARGLYELNNDPEVIKYTGDPPFHDLGDAKKFILNYDHYERWGHGRYSVLLSGNNTFLGWCGLKWNPEINELDLGFRFMKKHWGNGYATESSKACLYQAYSQLGYQNIIGRVMCPNPASIRVLQRLGFKFEKYISCEKAISEQWRHTSRKGSTPDNSNKFGDRE